MDYEFSAENLVADVYTFLPDLFIDDEAGHFLSLDHPCVEISFQLYDDELKGLIWDRRYFGRVMLNPVSCIRKGEAGSEES